MARLSLQRQAEAHIAFELGSDLGAISDVWPSFAINTASGSYKVINVLILLELNRSTSDATTPSGGQFTDRAAEQKVPHARAMLGGVEGEDLRVGLRH